MGTSSRFKQFLANANITPDDRDDADTKTNGVARKLHGHYYDWDYDESTRVLIGSYGKETQVRPPRDVDILFKNAV